MTLNRSIALLAAAGLLCGVVRPGLAQSRPDFTKDQIIEFFKAQPTAGRTRSIGAVRSICQGTEDQCPSGGAPTAAAAPQGFDLLVTFDLNSNSLTDKAKLNLMEFSKALKDPALSTTPFVVEGHTDARGSAAYNQVLSARRAAAVVSFLEEQGVPAKRLRARGYGKTHPRVPDGFDPVNRRVETKPAD